MLRNSSLTFNVIFLILSCVFFQEGSANVFKLVAQIQDQARNSFLGIRDGQIIRDIYTSNVNIDEHPFSFISAAPKSVDGIRGHGRLPGHILRHWILSDPLLTYEEAIDACAQYGTRLWDPSVDGRPYPFLFAAPLEPDQDALIKQYNANYAFFTGEIFFWIKGDPNQHYMTVETLETCLLFFDCVTRMRNRDITISVGTATNLYGTQYFSFRPDRKFPAICVDSGSATEKIVNDRSKTFPSPKCPQSSHENNEPVISTLRVPSVQAERFCRHFHSQLYTGSASKLPNIGGGCYWTAASVNQGSSSMCNVACDPCVDPEDQQWEILSRIATRYYIDEECPETLRKLLEGRIGTPECPFQQLLGPLLNGVVPFPFQCNSLTSIWDQMTKSTKFWNECLIRAIAHQLTMRKMTCAGMRTCADLRFTANKCYWQDDSTGAIASSVDHCYGIDGNQNPEKKVSHAAQDPYATIPQLDATTCERRMKSCLDRLDNRGCNWCLDGNGTGTPSAPLGERFVDGDTDILLDEKSNLQIHGANCKKVVRFAAECPGVRNVFHF